MGMPIFSKRGACLFLEVPDPIDVTGIKLLAYKIEEICSQMGITKVLVDSRNRTTPSHNSEELLEIGMFVAGLFRDRIQFAVMVDYRPEVHGFFSAVTEIRGALINFFEEESAALQWLGIEEI